MPPALSEPTFNIELRGSTCPSSRLGWRARRAARHRCRTLTRQVHLRSRPPSTGDEASGGDRRGPGGTGGDRGDGRGPHAHGPLCVPTCAQAAAQAGVYVNERHSQSTTTYREIEADKAFPGMLEQLCGATGKHSFPSKECGRGATKHHWTLAEAKLRPGAAGQGAVYRHFKVTVAYTRNVLNPLYIALCVKGPGGELMLPSG